MKIGLHSIQKDSGSPLLCKKVKKLSIDGTDISELLHNPRDDESDTKVVEPEYYLVGM